MTKRAKFWVLLASCALLTIGSWYVASHIHVKVTRDGQEMGQ